MEKEYNNRADHRSDHGHGHQSDRHQGEHEHERNQEGIFNRLFSGRRTNLSEDEIKDMVADNEELEEEEKRMIHEIIELGDMAVREIMQPRVDMILVEDEETGRVALERMRGTGYSRLPVYHEDIDGIVGIIHYKDLIGPLMDGRIDEPVTNFMYEPLFVPETKDILPLLKEMQDNRQQMAIVVDEYGGTDGLITIEDILEEIVGEIIDETDLERPSLKRIDDVTWRVAGRLPISEAEKLGWPVSESDDYETIAGWLIETIGSVPQMGDSFEIEGFRFTVEKMRRSRISVIKVEKIPSSGEGVL